MYFSKIEPDSEHILRNSGDESPLYVFHRLLWQLYPQDQNAKRDFLFRLNMDIHGSEVLVLSEREPHEASWCKSFEKKKFAPHLHNDQLLGFKIRVNPIVRGKKDHKRHDAIMHYKKLNQVMRHQEAVHDATQQWMKMRLEKNGATLLSEGFRADSYSRQALTDGKRWLRFSTVDVSGNLQVVDPACFMQSLSSGLGGSRSFGCGLMLLRQPSF